MTDEETLLLPELTGGLVAPPGIGLLPDDEPAVEGGEVGETALDASQRLLQTAAGQTGTEVGGERGRARERGEPRRPGHVRQDVRTSAVMDVDKDFTNSELEDAAIAAEALAAAMGRPLAKPPPMKMTDTGSLDSVRDIPRVGSTDRNPSPGKKPRVNKAPTARLRSRV